MKKSTHFILSSLLILMTLTASLITSCNQKKSPESAEVELCVDNYYTEEEAVQKLKEYAASYTNASEWQAHSKAIRKNIRLGAELDRIPEGDWKYEIRIVKSNKHLLDGYSVENIALEVKPGYFIHGNLYMPEQIDGKIAAVLSPHGHWFKLENYGRFRSDMQYRCASLAKMGAVVYAWDMLGTGEDNQNDHMDPKAIQKQTYNSIRVLDYISSLEFVDKNRIAVTGASGGGTQTFLLAAIDDRIDVSVPVVMVSAHFFGGCFCESKMPIHKRGDFETNNVEIAASIAPKPLMIISDGDDWTKNVPNVEYPYIKNIYEMFDAGDLVEYAHFKDEVHNYGFSKRKAAYGFLAKHLDLNLSKILNNENEIIESFVTILDTTDLKVFPDRNLVMNPQHW